MDSIPAAAVGPVAAAPANDEIAGATTITTALPTTINQDTSMATGSSLDPAQNWFTGDEGCMFGARNNSSVWYKYVSDYTGILMLDTFGSNYDTVLAVYSGSPPNVFNQIGCNDQANANNQSQVRVGVSNGQTYLIQVTAFATTSGGALKLNVMKQLANVIPRQPTVTPNGGSGVSQTFTFVFRDLDGVADMRQVNILINSSFNSANACYLVYDQYLGTISLLNDSASGVSKTRPGGPHNVENSQCIVLARSSSVTSNATDLTLTFSLAFKQTFAGVRNIYPFTTDIGGASTSIGAISGTWTVPLSTNQPPTAVSVSPSSGSGQIGIFRFSFSDPNGFADLLTTEVIFNSTLDTNLSCTLIFDRLASAVYLLTDNGTSFTRQTFGTAGSVANGQCSVDVSEASLIPSGNTLAVDSVGIAFKQSFAGIKNVYLYATDISAANSGLPALGTWTVPAFLNVIPATVSVSPSSGSGTAQTFTFTFSDPNGYGDLASPEVIINGSVDARNGCVFIYDRAKNFIRLVNDNGAGSAAVPLGSLGTVQNSQCVVFGSGSSATGSVNDLTLQVALVFKPAFAGARNVYMTTCDTGELCSGVVQRGTWTIPSYTNLSPTGGSVSPNFSSGQSTNLTATFTDPNGFADLVLPEVLINQNVDGRNACLAIYDRFSNSFYLVNDSSTDSTRVRADSLDTAENGQCAIDGGSFAFGSGNTLTMVANLTFKQSFAGTRNIFLYSQDVGGMATGFPNVGTTTAPPFTNQAPVSVSVSPASGSGSAQLFRLTFSDPNGFGDLVNPEFLMNSVLDARNGCVIIFDRLNGAAMLLNDAATGSTSVLLNSSQTAQNSQCTLLGQGSLALGSGNDLVLQLNLVFKPAFNGPKNVLMYTSDQAGANSGGLQVKGSYTVQ